MDDFLVSVRVHRVRFEIVMQNISLGMQNDAKMSSVGLEFDLFYHVEGVIAVFGASLHYLVHDVVRVNRLKIAQIFAELS